MKNFLKSASAFVLMLGAAVMLFTACDKKGGNSGGNGDVDKTKLEALIIECEALLDGATADDYPEANIEAFTNAVNDAKAIRDNQNATQSQVDLMTNNLTLAKETFVGSKYESIPDSSVIAFFDFETINDNTVASTGTKPVVGVLQAGPAEIFGSDTELPSLVDGVGAGKAIYFSKGNYLAVEDYNPADFLMNNMSWSAWVKVDDAQLLEQLETERREQRQAFLHGQDHDSDGRYGQRVGRDRQGRCMGTFGRYDGPQCPYRSVLCERYRHEDLGLRDQGEPDRFHRFGVCVPDRTPTSVAHRCGDRLRRGRYLGVGFVEDS